MNYSKYIKSYYPGFCAGIFCVIMEGICDLAGPALLASMVNKGIRSGSMAYILELSGMMLAVAFLGAMFAAGRNIAASIVSRGFGANLREDLFTKMLKMSASSIDHIGQGSLITRMTNDVDQIIHFINSIMRMAVKAPVVCIGSIFMTFILSPSLSIPVISSVIAACLLIYVCLKIGYARFYAVQKAIDRVATLTQEYLQGIRLVKAFGVTDYEEKRFSSVNTELEKASVSANGALSILTPFITLSIQLGTVCVFYLAGVMVSRDYTEIGIIMAFTTYMAQILQSIVSISNAFNKFVRTRASTERISEILHENEEPDLIKELPKITDSGIVFENVTFSYPGSSEEAALKNVSLTCESGDTLSILGATGSGKTTIVALLLGFYTDYQGKILIGNKELRNIPLYKLRDMIGIVPQRSMLFSGTVSENIRWGKQEASDSELGWAARTAGADEFIDFMPKAYYSYIAQGAANLSGGQKQRLSIARAVIKKPQILIFDDCTSALDVLTEEQVLLHLKKEFPHVTKVIVTQRLATAIRGDKILVMDNGCAAGEGTHKELMAGCEIYRDIYYSQMGRGGELVE